MEAKLRSVLLFDVADDTPHRVLTEATDAGVAAARAVVGGIVDTAGALGPASGGKKRVRGEGISPSEDARDEVPVARRRRVRIELAMRAAPAGVMQAERAFAAAFTDVLERRGHAVERL